MAFLVLHPIIPMVLGVVSNITFKLNIMYFVTNRYLAPTLVSYSANLFDGCFLFAEDRVLELDSRWRNKKLCLNSILVVRDSEPFTVGLIKLNGLPLDVFFLRYGMDNFTFCFSFNGNDYEYDENDSQGTFDIFITFKNQRNATFDHTIIYTVPVFVPKMPQVNSVSEKFFRTQDRVGIDGINTDLISNQPVCVQLNINSTFVDSVDLLSLILGEQALNATDRETF